MIRMTLAGLVYSVVRIPLNEILYSAVRLPLNETPQLNIELDDFKEDKSDLPDLNDTTFDTVTYAAPCLLLLAWFAFRRERSLQHTAEAAAPEEQTADGAGPAGPAGPAPVAPPRAKGKPPPPPKGKAPPKAKAKPRPGENPLGTRRVRWTHQSVGTVFEGLGRGSLRSETAKMLDEVFKPTGEKATARERFLPKSSGKCLLSQKRAQQLAIVFRRLPIPLQRLCSALLALDFSIPLGEEQVQGLLQAWPTADDFKAVANYDGPEELRDVELCIKQVAAVPRSEARLKLLRLARSLDSLHHASAELAVLRRACEELLGSRTLRALLDAALVLGNYINGDAGAGFSLDALAPSLMSLKGEKGTTALHCLCANRAQEDPFFCSKLHSELASLKTASQISLGALYEALRRVKEDVQSAAEELTQHGALYGSSVEVEELEDVSFSPIQPLGTKQCQGGKAVKR
ncbi:unnamed protein product [Effrenium voratum]|nr:unnamed protein product [Effrenium voratum]